MNLQSPNARKRIKYGIAFILSLFIEVLIALFVHDALIRPFVGDMLVVIVLYCFVRIFIPERCRILPLFILLFAVLVEISQYFDLVKRLGWENNVFLRILIGSVFDWKDILCYAAGCAVIVVYEKVRSKNMN